MKIQSTGLLITLLGWWIAAAPSSAANIENVITGHIKILEDQHVTVKHLDESKVDYQSPMPILITVPQSKRVPRQLQFVGVVQRNEQEPTVTLVLHTYLKGDEIKIDNARHTLRVEFRSGDGSRGVKNDLRYRLANEVTGSIQSAVAQLVPAPARKTASLQLNQIENQLNEKIKNDNGGNLTAADESYASLTASVVAGAAAALLWRLAPAIQQTNWPDKDQLLQDLFNAGDELSWLYSEADSR